MQETQVMQDWSLGGEDPLEEEMATPSRGGKELDTTEHAHNYISIPFSNKYRNEKSMENCLPTAFAKVICEFLIFVLMCPFPTYLTWAFTAYSSIVILPILT